MSPISTCVEEIGYLDERVRTRVFAVIAGILFAFGWWMFIDAAVYVKVSNDPLGIPAQLYLLGKVYLQCQHSLL